MEENNKKTTHVFLVELDAVTEATNLNPIPASVHRFHQVLEVLQTVCKRFETRSSLVRLVKAKAEAKELSRLTDELMRCAVMLNLDITVGMAAAEKEPARVDLVFDGFINRQKQVNEAESEFGC